LQKQTGGHASVRRSFVFLRDLATQGYSMTATNHVF